MNRVAKIISDIVEDYGGDVPAFVFFGETAKHGLSPEEIDAALKELRGKIELCHRGDVWCCARVR